MRIYSATFRNISVSAIQDIYEVLAGTLAPIKLLGLFLSQETEFGDAAAEMLDISIKRVTGAPTSGSGGGTITPAKWENGLTASLATVERNNTTQISGGTTTVLENHCFHVAAGFQREWPEHLAPVFSAGTRLVVSLNIAPDDAIVLSGTLIFTEAGG